MVHHPDEDRIRRKAHELWQAEGHPHGRDLDHWEQAREIIAIEDSHAATLLPLESGSDAEPPPSSSGTVDGDMPGLTDQGEHDLTDVGREPKFVAAAPTKPLPQTAAKTMVQPAVSASATKQSAKKKK